MNWFRKDDGGKFLWPGFGDNSRVLAWVFRRCDDAVEAEDTPIGRVPRRDGLDLDGLDVSEEDMAQLLEVDPAEWQKQLPQVKEHYAKFGKSLPDALRSQLQALEQRLGA